MKRSFEQTIFLLMISIASSFVHADDTLYYPCPDMEEIWIHAESLIQRGNSARAEKNLLHLIETCPSPYDRFETLKKIQVLINAETALKYGVDEAKRLKESAIKKDISHWITSLKIDIAIHAFENNQSIKANVYLQQLHQKINSEKDIGLARLQSEIHSKLNNIEAAIVWRNKAAQWSLHSQQDSQALIWLYLKSGKLNMAKKLLPQANKQQQLLITIQIAQQFFDNKEYSLTLSTLSTIEFSKAMNILSLKAWSLYHLKEYEKSLAIFTLLYKKSASESNSQGWFYSAVNTQKMANLLPQYQNKNGPLSQIANDPMIRKFNNININTNTNTKVISASSEQQKKMLATAKEIYAGREVNKLLELANSTKIKETEASIKKLTIWTKKNHHAEYARSIAAAYETLVGRSIDIEKENKNNWTEQAIQWRNNAILWSSAQDSDYLALSHSHLQLNDFAGTRTLIAQLGAHPNQELSANILAVEANKAYANKEYSAALKKYKNLSQYRTLHAGELQLQAWSYYRLKQFNFALAAFSKAYKINNHDKNSAQGIMFSAFNADNLSLAAELATELPGVLLTLFKTQAVHERALDGLSKDAASITSNAILDVLPITYSSLTITSGIRVKYRSGDSGTSQLLSTHLPQTQINWQPSRTSQIQFSAALVQLHSGDISASSLIGSRTLAVNCPLGDTDPLQCQYKNKIRQTTDLMMKPYLKITQDLGDGHRLFMGVGSTPITGEVPPLLTGELGFNLSNKEQGIELAINRRSNKESMLAYTGQIDPYTNHLWGRVVRNRINGTGYQEISDNWVFNFDAGLNTYQGKNTESNSSFDIYGHLKQKVLFDSKKSLSSGPTISLASFEKNLSGYTLRHGGYFSPQSIIKMSYDFEYIYNNNNQLIFKASLNPGYQFQVEDCLTDYTNNVGSCYKGSNQSAGINTAFSLGLQKQLKAKEHYLGADFSLNTSPQYNDWQVWVYWQYALKGDSLTTLFKRANHW